MDDGAFVKIMIGLGEPECDEEPEGYEHKDCEPDWKSLCKQLLQCVTLMDSQTDAAEMGEMSDAEAIKAIDEMTSRILWGKQSEDNLQSSYQNANYSDTVAAGMVMENKADLFNNGVYDADADNMESTPQGNSGAGFKDAASRMLDNDEDDNEEEIGYGL